MEIIFLYKKQKYLAKDFGLDIINRDTKNKEN